MLLSSLQMAPYITEDFPVTFTEAHKYVRVGKFVDN